MSQPVRQFLLPPDRNGRQQTDITELTDVRERLADAFDTAMYTELADKNKL